MWEKTWSFQALNLMYLDVLSQKSYDSFFYLWRDSNFNLRPKCLQLTVIFKTFQMDGHTRNHVKKFQNIARPPIAVSRQFGRKGQYVRYDNRFDWILRTWRQRMKDQFGNIEYLKLKKSEISEVAEKSEFLTCPIIRLGVWEWQHRLIA